MSIRLGQAIGSLTEIAFIKETTPNTVPNTGTVKLLKSGTESLDAKQSYNFDADISLDGMNQTTVEDLERNSGGFTVEPEKGAHDDFLLGMVRRYSLTTLDISDTCTSVGAGDGLTCTITGSGSVNLAQAIVDGVIKIAGSAASALNGIFRVVSAGASTLVVGVISDEQDLSGVSVAVGEAISITQVFAKNGGNEPSWFTFEKRFSAIRAENSFHRFTGRQINSGTVNIAPGGSVSIDFDTKGIGSSRASDGILSPHDWTVDGAHTAGDDTIAITGGTTNPAAGDILYFVDDSTYTRHTVTSFAAGVVTIEPALQSNLTTAHAIYFYRPATDSGNGKKMVNNLGYTIIDGSKLCVTSGTVTIAQDLQEIDCVGSAQATNLTTGNKSVSGTIVPYFGNASAALVDKIWAGTTFPISFILKDSAGNVFCFQVPQAKADRESPKRSDKMAIPINIPFKAEKSSTYGTNFIIHILTA